MADSPVGTIMIDEQTVFVSFIGLGGDSVFALEDMAGLMREALAKLSELVAVGAMTSAGAGDQSYRYEFGIAGGAAATLYVTRAMAGAS